MSYTKKNLNTITLLTTILLFISLYLIQIPFYFNSNSSNHVSKIKSNYIYSKIIPIKEYEKIKNLQKQENVNNIKTRAEMQSTSMDGTFLMQLLGRNSAQINKEQETTSMLEQAILEAQERRGQEENISQRQVIEKNKNASWRIEIPKLNLNVHIAEGTKSTTLLKAVGHFEGSSKWNGNVCLAAHNRGYNCNFFQKIKNLKVGDEIIYLSTKGKKIYRVQTNKVILETDWSLLENTKDNRITLITCEENRREYRRCVQAIEIETSNIL